MPPRWGVAAIAVAVAVAGCGGQEEQHRPPPPSPPPPPALAEAEIGDLEAVSVSAFAATIAWRTGAAARGIVAVGPPRGDPSLWWDAGPPARRQAVHIEGLAPSTAYRVSVTSIGSEGQSAEAAIELRTATLPAAPTAVVSGGVMRVDGSPFFPILSWGDCSDDFRTSLAVGTNLFAANRCGGLGPQIEALRGRAFSAAVAGESVPADAAGVVGVFHPDEPDGIGLTGATLPRVEGSAGVRLLTLTNHFYSGAAPLSAGRGVYPSLIARSDLVGFDLYPLQVWCRPDRLVDVFLAQQELVRLARGRPTFQWIESAGMECPKGQTAVTPRTVRVESWLAIAGGARGLGFFPPGAWTGAVGEAIVDVTDAVRYLGPALLAGDAPASVEDGLVKVAARAFGGALYVVAANASFAPRRARITVPGLADRTLSVFGEQRRVDPNGDSFVDGFPPLAARVYVAAPTRPQARPGDR